MTVLLDTHAFIWFNLNDAHLTPLARGTIEDSDNRIFISPASYWEIAIKIRNGDFALNAPYIRFWQSGIDDNGFEILPIEIRHTDALVTLPMHHKDPFDRLLVAQAIVEQIPIVSSDRALDAYGITRIW